MSDQTAIETLCSAIRFAMNTLAETPEGESATVDKAFNTLHDAYWSECPCPSDRPQKRGQDAAETA